MPGMRDQFAHFYAPDEDAIATAMKTGLVVPDTNVVLNLYRFQSEARDQLFGALEKPGDRLWIPHQVGHEFHRNRLTVMSDQEGYFTKTKVELDKSIQGFGESIQAFKRRLSLDDGHVQEIKDALARLGDLVADAVSKARELNEVRLKDHATDEVLDRIDVLFANENSVGKPVEPKELEEAKKEAERRIRDKIPPGYKDRNKDDPAGDYIVWRQTMTEAASRNLPVVFITDDSRSDDWYEKVKGQTLGARHELREEMIREAGVPLLMMTTETFLRHAETHLGATVSDETVDQAKDLPAIRFKSAAVRAHLTWDVLSDESEFPPLDGDAWERVVLASIRSRGNLPEVAEAWRARFEEALEVNPLYGEPEEIDKAANCITDYLGSGQATGAEISKAGGWRVVYDHRHEMRDSLQQPRDEPPAED